MTGPTPCPVCKGPMQRHKYAWACGVCLMLRGISAEGCMANAVPFAKPDASIRETGERVAGIPEMMRVYGTPIEQQLAAAQAEVERERDAKMRLLTQIVDMTDEMTNLRALIATLADALRAAKERLSRMGHTLEREGRMVINGVCPKHGVQRIDQALAAVDAQKGEG